jgi:CTD small phosphatase-like protein 2
VAKIGALSPMKKPSEHPLVRKHHSHSAEEADADDIFSPVLKAPTDAETTAGGRAVARAAAERHSDLRRIRRDLGPYTGGVTHENASALAAAAGERRGRYEEDYEIEEFNPYLFIKLLPPYEAVVPRARRTVLPRMSRTSPRISLVLDLDETLVHCSVEPVPDADMTFPVEFNGQMYRVYVRRRPYLEEFLRLNKDQYEVIIFTASQSVYAQKLLDILDPDHSVIRHRLYRDSCLNVDGNYLKDLSVLGRDLRTTVLVDNSPHAFGYQIDNGIPIESWFDDPEDTELLKLAAFLEELKEAPDVRSVVRQRFKVYKLVEDAR